MAVVTPTHQKGALSFAITGQTSHAASEAGSVGAIQNPEDCTIVVTNCFVYVSSNSTGACNLTIGTGATVAAAHDATELFAAAAMAAAEGSALVGHDVGDAADTLPIVDEDEYIAAFCSADSSGLAAIAYVEYVRVDD